MDSARSWASRSGGDGMHVGQPRGDRAASRGRAACLGANRIEVHSEIDRVLERSRSPNHWRPTRGGERLGWGLQRR